MNMSAQGEKLEHSKTSHKSVTSLYTKLSIMSGKFGIWDQTYLVLPSRLENFRARQASSRLVPIETGQISGHISLINFDTKKCHI